MGTLIIKNRAVVEDDWHVVRAARGGAPSGADAMTDASAIATIIGLPAGKVLVPLALWRRARIVLTATRTRDELGVWLAPDDDPADIAGDFGQIALIGIDFPVFRDGRGYSGARLLRERYGYKGELRALGDVLRDQLAYLARCGFDAFAVRAERDIHDALNAFDELTVRYQGAVDEPSPLFRRRAAGADEAAPAASPRATTAAAATAASAGAAEAAATAADAGTTTETSATGTTAEAASGAIA